MSPNPNTGNVIVDGVLQLTVQVLKTNPMAPEAIPEYLKTLSQTVVDCIKDAETALGTSVSTSTVAAATEKAATTERSAPRTAPAKQQTTRNAETTATTPVSAPESVASPIAEAPAATAANDSSPAAASPAAAQTLTISGKTITADDVPSLSASELGEAATLLGMSFTRGRGRPSKAQLQTEAEQIQTALAANSGDSVSSAVSSGAGKAATTGKKKSPAVSDDPTSENYRFAAISRTPVVPVGESVTDDAIICLIDGEKRKMMTRHLRSKYSMTDEQYRKHFDLPADYPMTAPGYSAEKAHVAVVQGLGKSSKKPAAAKATPAKVTKRPRKARQAAAA